MLLDSASLRSRDKAPIAAAPIWALHLRRRAALRRRPATANRRRTKRNCHPVGKNTKVLNVRQKLSPNDMKRHWRWLLPTLVRWRRTVLLAHQEWNYSAWTTREQRLVQPASHKFPATSSARSGGLCSALISFEQTEIGSLFTLPFFLSPGY